jgi:hypothetical protein
MRTTSQPAIPTPRSGLAGEWDKFIGPGATIAENGLIVAAFGLGLAVIAWRALTLNLAWTPWQWLVALLVGADILAGAVANSTSAAKRWYHRPGQTPRNHLVFVAIHAVHLVLLAIAFQEVTWTTVAISYGYLLIAAMVVAFVPGYLQRPVAVLAYGSAVLLSIYGLPIVPGLEWVFVVFYFKLLVAHMVREESQ